MQNDTLRNNTYSDYVQHSAIKCITLSAVMLTIIMFKTAVSLTIIMLSIAMVNFVNGINRMINLVGLSDIMQSLRWMSTCIMHSVAMTKVFKLAIAILNVITLHSIVINASNILKIKSHFLTKHLRTFIILISFKVLSSESKPSLIKPGTLNYLSVNDFQFIFNYMNLRQL